MNSIHHVYIALGSNKGDRLKYLQDAVDSIFREIGKINAIAKVYNTPAFGFEGDDFLNTCIYIESKCSAQDVLVKLQNIEKRLGRELKQIEGYESRTIDLDILLFDCDIIASKNLNIPHLQLPKRKFVLKPLCDIASKLKHPQLEKTVAELLESCEDESDVVGINMWLKNPTKQVDF